MLIKNGITPIYVFDGVPPLAKQKVTEQRAKQYNENLELYNNLLTSLKVTETTLTEEELLKTNPSLKEYKRKLIKPTEENINKCKEILTSLNILYIDAESEADITLAQLFRDKKVDAVLSEDFDTLAFGCGMYLREFNVKDRTVTLYNLDCILKCLNVTYAQFVDICILAGCDYSNTIKGIAIMTAYKKILEYGSIEKLLEKTCQSKIPTDFNYIEARKTFLLKQ
jgi:flap endonuclease-1